MPSVNPVAVGRRARHAGSMNRTDDPRDARDTDAPRDTEAQELEPHEGEELDELEADNAVEEDQLESLDPEQPPA
ncbi:hypothetical protein Agsp01_31270 [Agromyces sp. NBRC 114283]|nr:hypothetical protein Agsp01_31270 [Agromyces sp. NBRC 114283]